MAVRVTDANALDFVIAFIEIGKGTGIPVFPVPIPVVCHVFMRAAVDVTALLAYAVLVYVPIDLGMGFFRRRQRHPAIVTGGINVRDPGRFVRQIAAGIDVGDRIIVLPFPTIGIFVFMRAGVGVVAVPANAVLVITVFFRAAIRFFVIGEGLPAVLAVHPKSADAVNLMPFVVADIRIGAFFPAPAAVRQILVRTGVDMVAIHALTVLAIGMRFRFDERFFTFAQPLIAVVTDRRPDADAAVFVLRIAAGVAVGLVLRVVPFFMRTLVRADVDVMTERAFAVIVIAVRFLLRVCILVLVERSPAVFTVRVPERNESRRRGNSSRR